MDFNPRSTLVREQKNIRESCIRSIVLREPIVAKEKDKARSLAMAKVMDAHLDPWPWNRKRKACPS
jgi:hypothetical protein